MHVVLGATGRVGIEVVKELLLHKEPVRAVIRDISKAVLFPPEVEVKVANYFDHYDLAKAVKGGDSIFVLTPENPATSNFQRDTQLLLESYHYALSRYRFDRIVGLSSGGAQHSEGTGNLVASYQLEHNFIDLGAAQFFIRPGYYYSNWMGYVDLMKEHGILPTFFPPALKILMCSPESVGKFAAHIMCREIEVDKISEIGYGEYSSSDIADIFSGFLNRDITAVQTPPDLWESQLMDVGFSRSAADNMSLMTQAVIEGKTKSDLAHIPVPISFEDYLEKFLKS